MVDYNTNGRLLADGTLWHGSGVDQSQIRLQINRIVTRLNYLGDWTRLNQHTLGIRRICRAMREELYRRNRDGR